jgi:hypothetical protein
MSFATIVDCTKPIITTGGVEVQPRSREQRDKDARVAFEGVREAFTALWFIDEHMRECPYHKKKKIQYCRPIPGGGGFQDYNYDVGVVQEHGGMTHLLGGDALPDDADEVFSSMIGVLVNVMYLCKNGASFVGDMTQMPVNVVIAGWENHVRATKDSPAGKHCKCMLVGVRD